MEIMFDGKVSSFEEIASGGMMLFVNADNATTLGIKAYRLEERDEIPYIVTVDPSGKARPLAYDALAWSSGGNDTTVLDVSESYRFVPDPTSLDSDNEQPHNQSHVHGKAIITDDGQTFLGAKTNEKPLASGIKGREITCYLNLESGEIQEAEPKGRKVVLSKWRFDRCSKNQHRCASQ